MNRALLRWYLPIVLGVLLAAGTVIINDRYFFESVVVTSSSMNPSLLKNERAFLKRVGTKHIHRFDVIVMRSWNLGHRVVKRIVALPGECVQLTEGWKLKVDGRDFSYSHTPNGTAVETSPDGSSHLIQLKTTPGISYETRYGDAKPHCLSANEYYALGDNRLASGDSRYYGAVQDHEIDGHLTTIWYSYDLDLKRMRTERLLTRVK